MSDLFFKSEDLIWWNNSGPKNFSNNFRSSSETSVHIVLCCWAGLNWHEVVTSRNRNIRNNVLLTLTCRVKTDLQTKEIVDQFVMNKFCPLKQDSGLAIWSFRVEDLHCRFRLLFMWVEIRLQPVVLYFSTADLAEAITWWYVKLVCFAC